MNDASRTWEYPWHIPGLWELPAIVAQAQKVVEAYHAARKAEMDGELEACEKSIKDLDLALAMGSLQNLASWIDPRELLAMIENGPANDEQIRLAMAVVKRFGGRLRTGVVLKQADVDAIGQLRDAIPGLYLEKEDG